MSKDEICTCKACKNTVFHCQICKFVGFLLPSSSWLLKLPIAETRSYIFRWRSRFRRRRVCLSSLQSWTKRVENMWKRGLLYPLRPQYRTLAATPSPPKPMLIRPGFTSFVLSSNIDQGGGVGGISAQKRELVCHSCDCCESKTRIPLWASSTHQPRQSAYLISWETFQLILDYIHNELGGIICYLLFVIWIFRLHFW